MTRIGEKKLGLWARIKRLALTDVNAIVRGLNASDLEALERLLLESDFGVPATLDLVGALEHGVRGGRLRSEADLHAALRGALVDLLGGSGPAGSTASR